jgi:hypothetical protein
MLHNHALFASFIHTNNIRQIQTMEPQLHNLNNSPFFLGPSALLLNPLNDRTRRLTTGFFNDTVSIETTQLFKRLQGSKQGPILALALRYCGKSRKFSINIADVHQRFEPSTSRIQALSLYHLLCNMDKIQG